MDQETTDCRHGDSPSISPYIQNSSRFLKKDKQFLNIYMLKLERQLCGQEHQLYNHEFGPQQLCTNCVARHLMHTYSPGSQGGWRAEDYWPCWLPAQLRKWEPQCWGEILPQRNRWRAIEEEGTPNASSCPRRSYLCMHMGTHYTDTHTHKINHCMFKNMCIPNRDVQNNSGRQEGSRRTFSSQF